MNEKVFNTDDNEKDREVLNSDKFSSGYINKTNAKSKSLLGMIKGIFFYINKDSFLILW